MSAQQVATKTTTWLDMVSHDLFQVGYGEVWKGCESSLDLGWSAAEQWHYERGRLFGCYVLTENKKHVPLMKSGGVHPRALTLLAAAWAERALI
jgi:hypothetical protein